MAYREVCLGRFFITVLVCFIACFPVAVDSYSLRLQTGANDIDVEKGVTSNVDFYLDDYRSLDKNVRIIVQFKPSDRKEYDKKCQIEHYKTRCKVAFGPCHCVGPSSGAYQYRLSMNFAQQNAGQWMFYIVNQQSTSVKIVVIERQASLPTITASTPDNETTSQALKNGTDFPDSSSTVSITVTVISSAVIIVAIVSVIIIWRFPNFLTIKPSRFLFTHKEILSKETPESDGAEARNQSELPDDGVEPVRCENKISSV